MLQYIAEQTLLGHDFVKNTVILIQMRWPLSCGDQSNSLKIFDLPPSYQSHILGIIWPVQLCIVRKELLSFIMLYHKSISCSCVTLVVFSSCLHAVASMQFNRQKTRLWPSSGSCSKHRRMNIVLRYCGFGTIC
jgi:hypothetical protein